MIPQLVQVGAFDTISLRNAAGTEVDIISSGAIVQRLLLPTATGLKMHVVTSKAIARSHVVIRCLHDHMITKCTKLG